MLFKAHPIPVCLYCGSHKILQHESKWFTLVNLSVNFPIIMQVCKYPLLNMIYSLYFSYSCMSVVGVCNPV